MATLESSHTYRTRVCCYTASQISLNVLYYRMIPSVNPEGYTEKDFAETLSLGAAPLYTTITAAEARFRGVGVRDVATPLAVEATAVGNDASGLVVGGLGPTQCAGVISKYTALNSRRGRGRMYVGFPSIDDMEVDGKPKGTYVAGLFNLGFYLFGSITVGILNPVLMEPVLYSAGPTVLTEINKITVFRERERWGTQRRRGGFGQMNVLPF